MFRRKFVRLGSALLMILALSLPVASTTAPVGAFAGFAAGAISPVTTVGTGGGRTLTMAGAGFHNGLVPDADTVCLLVAAGTLPAVTVAGATAAVVNASCTAVGGVPTAATAATAGTSLTFVTPPHAAGAVPLAVHENSTGTWYQDNGTPAADITYVSPTATSVVPATGPAGVATAVTIGGTNLEGTTSVLFGATAGGAPGGLATPFTSMTSTSPTTLVAGAYAIGIVNAIETITTTVTFTVGAASTATATATAVPTVAGASCVSGTVVGTAPAGTRFLVPATGAGSVAGAPAGSHRVPAAHVVAVNLANGTANGTHTTGTANAVAGAATDGAWTLCLATGSHRISVADTDDDSGQTDCAATAGTACGHLIFQLVITVSAGGATTPSVTVIVLSPKTVPGALPVTAPVSTDGIFGEARDLTTGNPISGATVTVRSGLVIGSGAVIATTTTGADGRYSVPLLGASGPHNVVITPISGSCTVPGIADSLCGDAITTSAGWNDPAFLVLGAAALPTPAANTLGTGVLQGIIPMIFRDTDTSRTAGIDVETDSIRIVNPGTQRTIACVDFFGSDADGRRTTQQRQCLDLNPQAGAVLSGDIVPSGIMGFAEVYSVDLDGPAAGPCPGTTLAGTATPTPSPAVGSGCIYGVSDLHTVITHRVAEADNAIGGTNGLTCEDVLGTVAACGSGATTSIAVNQNMVLPIVMKNYGGTPDKWDSIVHACQASGVPVTQPIVFEFWSVNGPAGQLPSGANAFLYNRTADPGGCVTFNLRTLDFLPDGPWAVNVTSTGLQSIIPVTSGANLSRPNTFTLAAISYSRTGKGATAHNGYSPAGGGGATAGTTILPGQPVCTGTPAICASKIYGPLIFSDYSTGGGSWWSGVAFGNFPASSTGGTTAITMTIIDESGVTRGVINDRASGDSTTVFWLGAQPGTENRGVWNRGRLIVPLDRNFRGSFIADVAEQGGVIGTSNRRVFASVQHTNYARRAFISYNSIREEALNPTQFGLPAQANDTRPCLMQINTQLNTAPGGLAPIGSTCLWVPEVFAAVPSLAARSQATGVRLFNPGANVITADVLYFDAAGIEWTDSRTTFSIGPFSTATIFTGTDFKLPANFSGSVYITAACSVVQAATATCSAPLAAVANIVDYSVTTRDTSRAFNLPTQSGFTQ